MEISGATACVLDACKAFAAETDDASRMRAIQLLEAGDYQACKMMAIEPELMDDRFFAAMDYLCGAVSRPPSPATITILREAAGALADAVARDTKERLLNQIRERLSE